MRRTVLLLVALLAVSLAILLRPRPQASEGEIAPEGSLPEVMLRGSTISANSGEHREELAEIRALIEARGDLEEAEERARSLLLRALEEQALDEGAKAPQESPWCLVAIDARDVLVRVLYVRHKRQEAATIALAREAVAEREALLGPEDPSLLESLRNLGAVLQSNLQLEEAQAHMARALNLAEKSLDPDSVAFADVLNWYGSVLIDAGKKEEAKEKLVLALGIQRTAAGLSRQTGQILSTLANLHCEQGDFRTGKKLYGEALQSYLASLPPTHPLVARGYHNLGEMLHIHGEREEARRLFEQALEIRRTTYGDRNVTTGYTHASLAIVLREEGDYGGARRHFRWALLGLEEGVKKDHPHYAFALSELALLFEASGDLEGALSLQQEAFATRLASRGPEHAEVGQSMARIGRVALEMGDETEARTQLEGALTVLERSLSREHPDLREPLLGLAELVRGEGDLSRARRLVERSKEISHGYDPYHPDQVEPLMAMAQLDLAEGNPGAALDHLERAEVLLGRASRRNAPHLAAMMVARSRAFLDTGQPRMAWSSALNAASVARQFVRQTMSALAEREALHLAQSAQESLDLALSIVLAPREPDGELWTEEDLKRTWEGVIGARALLLREALVRHRMVAAATDSTLQKLAQDWVEAREHLTSLLVAGSGLRTPKEEGKRLEAARLALSAEQELVEYAVTAAAADRGRDLGWQDVIDGLPPGGALVALSRYRSLPASTRPTGDPMRYMAFVLREGEGGPRAVPLGSAREVEAAIVKMRRHISPGLLGKPGSEAGFRRAGLELRRRIWDPLEEALREASTVFWVPDGELNLVNFAALPAGEGAYLAETAPLFHILEAETDLAMVRQQPSPGNGLLIVGDPSFQGEALVAGEETREGSFPDRFAGLFSGLGTVFAPALLRESCGAAGEHVFLDLPGTGLEVEEISALWANFGPDSAVNSLTGQEAREEEVKRSALGKRVVHVASHGFSLSGRCFDQRGVSSSVAPLTGLALAGANGRRLGSGEDDGILSADEIASLDLRGVEWAVLSACETALGEIWDGEGVLGLRRAFRVAGARTVIMSLWSVEDQATRQWMKALYQGRLQDQLSTAEAVRHASLEVLRRRRSQGHSTHPAFWAGFVAAGDWR